jgi:hypothetical protein
MIKDGTVTLTRLPNSSQEDFFCSQLARTCEEQIAGTATEMVTAWLALEAPEAWGAKAVPESNLSAAVKEQLEQWQREVTGTRVQLIKQGPTFATDGILFFVGLAAEGNSQLYRFQLNSYEDLLTFDLASIVARHPSYDRYLHAEPIFLVCTHGRRDRCCAKWGLPFYHSMAEHAGAQVWQTTHTGGHRFAATMVCLPEGVCYGWLDSEDAVPLLDSHRLGLLYRLDRYRGRSCHSNVAQAADALLRSQTGLLDLDAFRLVSEEQIQPDHWQVIYEDRSSQQRYSLALESTPSDFCNPQSCSKTEGENVPQYSLHDFHVG